MSETQSRFTKIAADGAVLPREATEWEAVLDNTTGLMWSKEAIEVDNHNDAQTKAKACQAAGFTDWGAPTAEQQFCLADRSRVNPSIDTEFFPDCPSSWFHTSTVDCEDPSEYSWFVFFDFGNSLRFNQNSNGFVRAVRVGQ
jgi:hypothetical protein